MIPSSHDHVLILLLSHSVMSDSLQPDGWSMPGIPVFTSQSLLRLMSRESMMPSNYLILCCPLLLLPSIFPSFMVFSNELALRIRWLNYLSFGLSVSPSNEYSELISFNIDWFDLCAVQRTLNSCLVHHHSAKASIQKLRSNPRI